MKILHFADLHLGVENYSHIDPASGFSDCFNHFLAAFDEVVDFALKEGVDLVLFCGDAYKSRDPSQTQQREFAKRIARLAARLPVFLLVGNHDLPNAVSRATTLEIFDTLAVNNVTVASRPGVYQLTTPGGLLQIVALPWLRRSGLLSKEESKNLRVEETHQRLAEVMTQQVNREIAKLNPSLPAILAAHVSLFSARSGTEKLLTVGHEPSLLPSNLANPALDYVALGHIHIRQTFPTTPPLVYSGSLERLDFSDEEDAKGFLTIEINPAAKPGNRLTAVDFHQVKARRFLTIKVSIPSEDLDPTATILHAIARYGAEIPDAIVRLQVSVSEHSAGLIQEPAIHKVLSGAQWVTIAKEIKREHRIRLGDYSSEGIAPLEALQVYLRAKKTAPPRTRLLLEYGARLVAEVNAETEVEHS